MNTIEITIADITTLPVDAIVNAAAYTAVDKAEREYRKAFAVNASAVHNLAAAAYEAKVRFIHISTDYVFEGDGKNPYCEHDVPNPQSIYGKSKLSGEFLALAAIGPVFVFVENGILEKVQQLITIPFG